MAEPLDTFVMGDREAMTSAADWIINVGSALGDMGDSGQDAVTSSESIWGGEAGPAFRNTMSVNVTAADDGAGHTETVGAALQTLREELDTVHSRMGQARSTATDAGLTVDGDFIMPPDDPPAEPGDGASDKELSDYEDAVDAHNARVDAFNECMSTVTDARDLERRAHELFQTAVQRFSDGMQTVQSTISTIASHANSYVFQSGAYSPAVTYFRRLARAEGTFADAARRWNTRAQLARQQLMHRPPGSTKGQRALLRRIDRSEARSLKYHQLSNQARNFANSRWTRFGMSGSNRLMTGLQHAARYSFADHMPKHRVPYYPRHSTRTTPRIPGRVTETLRRGLTKVSGPLTLVGTGVGIYNDIQGGMSWQEATAKGGTTLAAGAVAGGLAQAGVAAMAVPGAGWAVGAGILVGAGASYLVSQNWDTISNAAEDVGGAIADGAGAAWDEVTSWF